MKLFRNRTAAPDAAPAERLCRGCGDPLAPDQAACLTCGAVDAPATGRDRRWLLPTGGVVGVALFLVTSASFAATTALRTGDPTAIKEQPPQVAQAPPPAIPPASGDGTAPQGAEEGKGPDPGAGGDAPAPPAPAPGGGADAPAGDGGNAGGGGGANPGPGAPSGGGGGSSDAPEADEPDEPAPAKVSEWPAGREGYTVVVYTFNSKSEARAKARQVAADGLPAGILNSSNFASLESGSWLVYIGQYDSAKEAERASRQFQRDYPGEVTYVGQNQSPDYEEPQTDASGSGSSGSSEPTGP